MSDDVPPQVEQLIEQRRRDVAHRAAQDLQQASAADLPDVLHRLAGKLGVFGYEAAGDASRDLMHELRENTDVEELRPRVARIVSMLAPADGGRS